MKLQEYLKKSLEEISKQCITTAEIELILDDKLNVTEKGHQRISLTVYTIK